MQRVPTKLVDDSCAWALHCAKQVNHRTTCSVEVKLSIMGRCQQAVVRSHPLRVHSTEQFAAWRNGNELASRMCLEAAAQRHLRGGERCRLPAFL